MNWNVYLETLVYLWTGIVIFLLFIFLLDKLTPWSLQKELIEDENVALAIIIWAFFIAIGLIISAAIR